MATADLIPTGRTSLVKHGMAELQIQTEYAHRPLPRITTTVQRSGQVVQKIERNLNHPITSIEEKEQVETTIRKQHLEVIDIIQRGSQRIPIPPELTLGVPPVIPAASKDSESKPYPEAMAVMPLIEKLESLPGTHRVYRLDSEGNFINAEVSKEFRKAFRPIFKNLHELLSLFAEVPGIGLTHETGVVEIERDALYLISTGFEFYIFCLERPDYSIEYERELRALLRKAESSSDSVSD